MAKVLHFLIVISGLAFFEIITSIDNAVVNAHVLKTLPEKYRYVRSFNDFRKFWPRTFFLACSFKHFYSNFNFPLPFL
jgi:hypothetical protein